MDTVDSNFDGTAGRWPAQLTGGIPDLSLRLDQELKRLGPLQETYTPDPSSSRILWTCFLVFFLFLGLLVSAIPFLPPPKDVPPASPLVVLLIVLVIGFILLGCVWRLRQLTRERRARILVFAEGLARFDGKGLFLCRWEDIASVQGILYKARRAFASHIIVTVRGGKPIRTYWANEHLAVGEVLFQRLSEESSRHLLPRFLGAVEAGQTVSFQAPRTTALTPPDTAWSCVVLGISESGLHWGTQTLAWDDTDHIDFEDGLRIRPQSQTRLALVHRWVRLADIPIPNSLVFLRLAEHYLRKNGRHVVPRMPAT